MALLARFFGRTVGEGAGVAIGEATAEGVQPALTQLGNTMREHFHHDAIEPQDAAALRARETLSADYPGIDLGRVDPSHEARYSGVRQERFDALTELAREHPSVGELITLRRRRMALGGDHGIGQAEFREWLRRTGFSRDVIDALTKLLTTYLSPEDVANAVQQGFVPGDDLLPPPDSGPPPYTPPTEQVNIDPSNEAGVSGIDRDRLQVLAELSGNPPGPETLLEMWRRGIITETAVNRGIREGRTKTKWTPAIKALFRPLLNPAVLVNRYLRGWDDLDAYAAKMELHGYDRQQAIDWYESAGRPAAPVQMQTAWARGIDGPDGRPMDREQFLKGIRESDIRPEWGPMLWGIRHNYPTLFQLRGAVQSGGITRQRALTILGYERYEDQDAVALVDSWLRGGGTTKKGLTATDLANEYEALWITRAQYIAGLKELGYSDADAAAKADAEDARRARLARNQLIARIRTQYVAHRISLDTATAALNRANVPARVRDSLLPDWTAERELTADALSAAQIKKAWKKVLMTRDEAIARLEFKGYDADDANIYLDE